MSTVKFSGLKEILQVQHFYCTLLSMHGTETIPVGTQNHPSHRRGHSVTYSCLTHGADHHVHRLGGRGLQGWQPRALPSLHAADVLAVHSKLSSAVKPTD